MITYDGNGVEAVKQRLYIDVKDPLDILEDNEILLRGKIADAKDAVSKLGKANASYRPLYWKRTLKQETIYTDWIITLK